MFTRHKVNINRGYGMKLQDITLNSDGELTLPDGLDMYEDDDCLMLIVEPKHVITAQPNLVQIYNYMGMWRALTYPDKFWMLNSNVWTDAIKLYDEEISEDGTKYRMYSIYVGHATVDAMLKEKDIFTANIGSDGILLSDLKVMVEKEFARALIHVSDKYNIATTPKTIPYLIESGFALSELDGTELAVRDKSPKTYAAIVGYEIAAVTQATSEYEAMLLFSHNKIHHETIVTIGLGEICNNPTFEIR